jgi:BolA protein
MGMQQIIDNKLRQDLAIQILTIENESHLHRGPASDSHFKVVVVSDDFEGKRPVARHQMIYGLLNEEFEGAAIHALVLHLYTADEWRARGGEVPVSAPCGGGGH